jgi:predicted transcriptional regulator
MIPMNRKVFRYIFLISINLVKKLSRIKYPVTYDISMDRIRIDGFSHEALGRSPVQTTAVESPAPYQRAIAMRE